MPHVEKYAEQQNGQNQQSSLNLLDIIAHTRPTTSGLAVMMTKTLLISSSLATVGGIAATTIFAPLIGPVIPFLIGSGVGFIGGLVQRWSFDTEEAIAVTEQYPKLINFHLRHFKVGLLRDHESFADWKRDIKTNSVKQAHAVLAMYSAAESLTALRKHQEEEIVQRIKEAGPTKLL